MKTNTKYFEVFNEDITVQMIKVTFSGGKATVTSDTGKVTEVASTAIKPTNTKGYRLYGKYTLVESKEQYFQQEWDKKHILDDIKPEYHVCICGSRQWQDYSTLADYCDKALAKKAKTHNIIIHSGKARGADTLGEQYAKRHNYGLVEHPALWDTEGTAAGYNRNDRVLKAVDAVIAFPLEKSPGTAHMINSTKRAKKPIRVCTAALPVKK